MSPSLYSATLAGGSISGLREVSDNTRDSSTTGYRVKEALVRDLKASPLSRAEVAVRLSREAGRHISLPMIEAFLAPTKPHRFPAELIPAWVLVTGSRCVLEVLCAELGLFPATPEDRDFAELGRTRLLDEKLTRRLMERIP